MGSETPLITPSAGGRYITSESADTVGALNYVEKVNFRRLEDVEARREGWTKFRPNASLPQGTQHLAIDTVTYGKVTLIAENVRPNSERCAIAATKTHIFRFNYSLGTWSVIGSGFSPNGRRWQTAVINGWIIFNNAVDLPVSYRVEDSAVVPLKELREVGVASVGWIAAYNGFLMAFNVVEIKAAELAGVMNSGSPYGIVADANKLNHIPYRVIWSEFGLPTNWSPVFSVTMNSASATIALPFPSSIFVAGTTRVAVINGGPNGDTLGGDSAHPDGILVNSVSGSNITLELSTDAGLSYPRTVQVTRWTDISAISAYRDLQDDASAIICAKELNGSIIVYRTRGIFVGRYTGSADAPFDFKDRPKSVNMPLWGEAVANVNGEYHVYPDRDGRRFYMFDGVNLPTIHPVLDACRDRLMDGMSATSDVFAVDNPLTKEIWFCRPDRTICFDYLTRGGTASEIDAQVDAAGFIARPGWEDDWFVIAQGGVVFTYGFINGKPTTWLRDGATPGARLKWGLNSFGDVMAEKTLLNYGMMFASSQQPLGVRLRLWGYYSASKPSELLLDETIADPSDDGGVIPMSYLSTYFQDELSLKHATPPHSADFDGNWLITQAEYDRVLALYNYRNESNVRTGEYHSDPGQPDGFAAGPGAITSYHSADSNKDGRIDLAELTRVSELKASATGYKPQVGTEDGYGLGAIDQDCRFIGRVMERNRARTGGAARNNR